MTPGFLVRIGNDGRRDHGQGAVLVGPAALSVTAGEGRSGPRLAQRGALVAVADLRLDNRDDLVRQLDAPGQLDGHRGADEPDDLDLLLAAYERWGDALAEHLDGPFAFVVWDGRRERAVVARDALGLRPLYHARLGRDLLLASSLPLLRARVPGEVSEAAAADHLTGRLDHPHQTAVAGVERVPPAHRGTVQIDGERASLSLQRYWALDPLASHDAVTDAEAERGFRERFDRAVRVRLGGAPGALLSGGLDSSSIVATARALCPGAALPTFSIVYDDPAADERRYVDAVAAHAGVDPLRLQGDGLSLLAALDDDLRAVGEPFLTPNLFLTRALYAEAAAQGLDAVLDGFAGDGVVGHGDRWLTELALGLRWPTFVREAAAVARRSRRPRRAALALVREYALAPLVRPLRRPRLPAHFARPDLVLARLPREPFVVRDRDHHHRELAGPLVPRAFEVAYARASALGVEPRFPFADRALVAFCLALPPRQRVRDGLTRSVLRRAMGGRLPEVLRQRHGKARIGGSFQQALFERDPERLRDLVETDVPAASAYLDVGAVREAYRRGAAHPEARGELALPLWRAVSFARWLSLSAR